MRIDDPLDLCAPRNLERASTVNFMMASSLTFLSRQALTPWMQDHLDQMGFESPVRYRLWCHRHGFDSSLEKPDVQLKRKLVTQARGKYNMQPFDKARVRRNQEGLRHGK